MRQGFGCLLVEAQPGSLAELDHCLDRWRLGCQRVARADVAEPGHARADLLVIEIGQEPPSTWSTLTAAWRPAGRPVLALCPQDGAKALSIAASLGVDDVLLVPLDPAELARRLQLLAAMGELAAERRRRTDLFAPYLQRNGRAPPPPSPTRALIAVLGEPDATQVNVTTALPPADVTYLASPAQLPVLLRRGLVDLLLVTRPSWIMESLLALEQAGSAAPMLLAAHSGSPSVEELPPQVDLLPLPAPAALARLRLGLVLRIAGLRRWLRDPPLQDARALLIDSLTGAYNQGAFLDYLRTTGDGSPLVALELNGLDRLNARIGNGNLALAEFGRRLRRATRAEDFAAHLGGGRFAVAVASANRRQLDRMCHRLQLEIGDGVDWGVLAVAEGLPVRGAPAQRLARLFGDLRRVRPAA